MPAERSSITDEELLTRLARGDHQAFSELYNRYWEDAFNAAYARLRDEEQSQDIAQNVFVSIWDRRGKVRIDNFRAYLLTAIKFQVIKYSTRNPYRSVFVEDFSNFMLSPAVIAATNRDLQAEVDAGRFRMDLYYRLNVFPITLPPLRDRLDDIPVLARHFIEQCSRKLGRPPARLTPSAIEALQHYSWPGNIRELEHIIERAILINREDAIHSVALPAVTPKREPPKPDQYTLGDMERHHIIQVLKQCRGKVAGQGGAAELLKMHSSTLNSRIKKLGIQKMRDVL
jgi:RNA polymerase sigma factor (sigma-70 family)